MKTEEDIKNRIIEIKKIIALNETILSDYSLTYSGVEEIDLDNYELKQRIKILEWVLS